jgi:hypothetical protein
MPPPPSPARPLSNELRVDVALVYIERREAQRPLEVMTAEPVDRTTRRAFSISTATPVSAKRRTATVTKCRIDSLLITGSNNEAAYLRHSAAPTWTEDFDGNAPVPLAAHMPLSFYHGSDA